MVNAVTSLQQYLCSYSSSTIGGTARGMVRIKKGEETDLMAAVAIAGPVTIGVDHGHSAFQVTMMQQASNYLHNHKN